MPWDQNNPPIDGETYVLERDGPRLGLQALAVLNRGPAPAGMGTRWIATSASEHQSMIASTTTASPGNRR